MKLLVLNYSTTTRAHLCQPLDFIPTGRVDDAPVFVDLFVGSEDLDGETEDSLIGKTIECSRVSTFLLIGIDAKVVEKDSTKQSLNEGKVVVDG